MKLGSLLGADVLLAPTMAAVLGIAVLTGAGARLMLTFAFVLLHELCHTAAAHRFGVVVEEVELMPFGGVARAPMMANGARREWIIAMAGPAFNLALAGALALLAVLLPSYAPYLKLPFTINLSMGLFNLLPAYPLDGGRVLHHILCRCLPPKTAERTARYMGMALGTMLMALGLWGAAEWGVLNPMVLSVGGYMVIAAHGHSGYGGLISAVGNWQSKRRGLLHAPLEQRTLTAGCQMTVGRAAARLHKRRYTAFCVVDDALTPLGTVYEDAILSAVLAGNSQKTLGELLRNHQE